MNISREEMTNHINAGRATEWTHPLAGQLPTAATMNGTWYVILNNTNHYQPAPPQLATMLTQAETLLTAAANATMHQRPSGPSPSPHPHPDYPH